MYHPFLRKAFVALNLGPLTGFPLIVVRLPRRNECLLIGTHNFPTLRSTTRPLRQVYIVSEQTDNSLAAPLWQLKSLITEIADVLDTEWISLH
jgi:hypothetical protein